MTSYGRNGTWRTARSEHRCDMFWGDAGGGRCSTVIHPGERYWDTKERNGNGGGWETDRLCPSCAEKIGIRNAAGIS